MRHKRMLVGLLGAVLVMQASMIAMAAEPGEVVVIEMEEVAEETLQVEEALTAVAEGEPLVIASGTTTLDADVTVPSVTISGGTLNLAGYTLTVSGDVTQTGGTIALNKGTLIIGGNFDQSGKSVMNMTYTDDKVSVAGDYATESSGSVTMENGNLEIGGDLLVKSGNSSFCSKGNHTVRFTGEDSHLMSVIPDSTSIGIANLQVDSGLVTVESYFSVGKVLNDLEVTMIDGHLMNLRALGVNGKNVTIKGDVLKHTKTLDVAGGNLIIEGNLYQRGLDTGIVSINKGTMTVTGDYIQEEGYYAQLLMKYTNDRLNVNGDFKTYSEEGNELSAGVMTIGGDLVVGVGNDYNFSASDTHEVVFSGEESHTVQIKDILTTRIANLKVESGKLIVDSYLPVGKIESDLDITVPEGVTLGLREFGMNGKNVTIHGNVYKATKALNLAGGNLLIDGNFTQGGNQSTWNPDTVKINKGTMTVTGDYIQKEGYYSILEMKYTNDQLNVYGNFETCSVEENVLTAGVMTIHGNLIIGPGNEYNFCSKDTHEVVLGGTEEHLISWEWDKDTPNNSEKKTIANLKVESGKFDADNFLNITKLESDLHITVPEGKTLYLKEFGMNGHTVVIDGNVVKLGGTLNLAAGKLTINGNFTQQGGTVKLSQGTMTVNGDYVQEEGYKSVLKMENTNDILVVTGDFVTYSDSKNALTGGTMSVEGDFTQGGGNAENFAPSGTHTVKLNGEGVQNVIFRNYPSSYFNIVYVSKPLTTGYVFQPESCWKKATGYVNVYSGFSDIQDNAGNWKYENVKYVYEHGIMTGISGTNDFAPDQELTRAMFATVLYRMAGEPEVDFAKQFTDVEDGKYYSKPVIWAYKQAIVKGFDDGSYGVNNPITREQIAKMLCEYGRVQGYDMSGAASLDHFTDKDQVNGWAVGYMQWAVDAGMISGKPNGDGTFRLDPKGNATRAECAKMLSMFMQKYVD